MSLDTNKYVNFDECEHDKAHININIATMEIDRLRLFNALSFMGWDYRAARSLSQLAANPLAAWLPMSKTISLTDLKSMPPMEFSIFVFAALHASKEFSRRMIFLLVGSAKRWLTSKKCESSSTEKQWMVECDCNQPFDVSIIRSIIWKCWWTASRAELLGKLTDRHAVAKCNKVSGKKSATRRWLATLSRNGEQNSN